jgi:predicted ribosome quality control (RQC) complex YloA/Tae2 family protein
MDGLAIAASLGEMRKAVLGGLIRTVHQPSRDTFVLHVFAASSCRVLISPRDALVHLTARALPNPQTPSGFVMLLRKHLRGGRLVGIWQRGLDRVVAFEIERRDGSRGVRVELVAELAGLRGGLLLVRDGVVLGASRRSDRNRPGERYAELPPQRKLAPGTVSAGDIERLLGDPRPAWAMAREVDGIGRQTAEDILRAAETGGAAEPLAERVRREMTRVVGCAGEPRGFVDAMAALARFYPLPELSEPIGSFSEALDLVADLPPSKASAEAGRTRTHLLREIARRERTAARLREWLGRAEDADRLRHEADLLLIHAHELPRSSSGALVVDPESGREIRVSLDPALSPIENAQRLHRRAKRMRRGRPQVGDRLARIEREIGELRSGLEAIDVGDEIPEEVADLLPKVEGREKKTRTPSRRQLTIGGFTVLVGRSARENDDLLRDAAPDDVWMHARGVAGSHVIVRRGGRVEIPLDVLRKAAGLAAHHSKARGERRVAVTVAAAKHVRKPRGAPPGLAIVEAEDTLTVDPGLREWE